MNQLRLSIDSAYTLANKTESAFSSFKNNTESSFVSVSAYIVTKSANSLSKIKDHICSFLPPFVALTV